MHCSEKIFFDAASGKKLTLQEVLSKYFRAFSSEGEADIEEEQARNAALSNIPVHQRIVPPGCRFSFGIAVNQLLNGPETYALIQSCLLSRVEENEDDDARCGSCKRSNKNCGCYENKKVIVLLISMACSIILALSRTVCFALQW